MHDEIDDLILLVLKLYPKHIVTGDTPEVAELSEKLVSFATRRSVEDELREVRRMHLPTRSNQRMMVEDANAIIRYLLSLRSRIMSGCSEIKHFVHPAIWHVAEARMESGQYADAVESAFKELNNRVKEQVQGQTDKDGVALMTTVFSPDKPLLLVEENLDTQTNKDTQKGYMMMFSGAMSAIRNPKAHENMTISKDDAVRKLMFASMLMYKLESSKKTP